MRYLRSIAQLMPSPVTPYEYQKQQDLRNLQTVEQMRSMLQQVLETINNQNAKDFMHKAIDDLNQVFKHLSQPDVKSKPNIASIQYITQLSDNFLTKISSQ